MPLEIPAQAIAVSPRASSSQTLSYLTRRFAEAGVRPKPRHGQNFLIDLNLQRLIVDRAHLDAQDVVLEVGTGTALAALMAPLAAAVVTIEIDPQLYQLAQRRTVRPAERGDVFGTDALKNKGNLDPRLIATIESQLAAAPRRRMKLVANLPYSVATPVMANLLSVADRAGVDDRHRAKGNGRTPGRQARNEGLQCAERMGAKPMRRGAGAGARPLACSGPARRSPPRSCISKSTPHGAARSRI